jgi:AcrR family transcriptional regulator
MVGSVKRQAPDQPTLRQRQARQTRLAVLAAARTHFLDAGYAKTTMPAIAAEAGVSVETVYKLFANKAGLVKAVFDVAVVGDDEQVPMMEREFVQQNAREPDPRRKLEQFGQHLAEVNPRIGPLLLVVRDAAATNPDAEQVWQQMQRERLIGMAAFAHHLNESGHLRRGVSVDEARDVLWTHNSVDLWNLLVNQRHWTDERLGQWIGQQLIAALL